MDTYAHVSSIPTLWEKAELGYFVLSWVHKKIVLALAAPYMEVSFALSTKVAQQMVIG